MYEFLEVTSMSLMLRNTTLPFFKKTGLNWILKISLNGGLDPESVAKSQIGEWSNLGWKFYFFLKKVTCIMNKRNTQKSIPVYLQQNYRGRGVPTKLHK